MLVQLERNAEISPSLTSVVEQLRHEQVTDWLNKDKSVLDVLNILKLKDDGYIALRSRKLEVLEDYITKFNLKTSRDESLLAVLTKSYGGEGNVVALLTTAMPDLGAAIKAKAMETDLLTKWTKENQPLTIVWNRLQFDDSVDNALSSGKLRVFYKYVTENYPSSKKSVIEKFAAKYGELEVAQALATAKGQWAKKDIATKLQNQQLKSWVTSGQSADDVFTSLRIKSDDYLLMKSWKMETLEEYIKLFNPKQSNPQDETNPFRVLRNGFGGDGDFTRTVARALETGDSQVHLTATEFLTALHKRWVGSNIQPEDIHARVFSVNEASAGTLENTIVSGYKKYYDTKIAPPQVCNFNDPRRA